MVILEERPSGNDFTNLRWMGTDVLKWPRHWTLFYQTGIEGRLEMFAFGWVWGDRWEGSPDMECVI